MINSSLLQIILVATLAFAGPVSHLGALYSMTNDPSGNSVVINAVKSDGSLTYAGFAATGGTGVHNNDGPIHGPDSTFSQSPVKVYKNQLYVVNPKSNTVSVFSINPSDPLDIKLVGKPFSSRGDFPVSIYVSPETGDVCVLNSGKKNGVICFKMDPAHGTVSPQSKFYSFGLNQTTPPIINNSGTQVLFSAQGSKLRASVKGNLTSGGYIASWDVAADGRLSPSFTKSVPLFPNDGGFPYGMVNVVGAEDAVIASDPVLGLTIYDFSKKNTTYIPLTIDGQIATCWVEYSSATSSYWLSDVTAGKIYEVSVDSKTLKPSLLSSHDLGTPNNATELAVGTVSGDQYLYALSPNASSINVFSLKKGGSNLFQSYDFGKVAKGLQFTPVNLAGAALYLV